MADLRDAVRLIRKSPLFTVTVVVTIALGIGASTAIFSVVNAILVRPLPYAEPQRLVQVAEKNDALKLPRSARRHSTTCRGRSGRGRSSS